MKMMEMSKVILAVFAVSMSISATHKAFAVESTNNRCETLSDGSDASRKTESFSNDEKKSDPSLPEVNSIGST